MLARLILQVLFFLALTSFANSACRFEELPRNRLIAGALEGGHSERFLSSLARDGKVLGNPDLIRDAFLQSITPSLENSDRLVRAGIIYSEILTRWNRSLSSFIVSGGFISDDFKKRGLIESLVLPLIGLVELGTVLNRRDIASVANLGLAELNPALANRFCDQFSLQALTLSQFSLPTRSDDLSPDARLAFTIHSYFNSIPAIERTDPDRKPLGGMEAVVGDGSAWKHHLIANGGAIDKPTRTDCHIGCNWKAIGPFTRTLVSELSTDLLPDSTGKPGPDGKQTDLVFPASIYSTGKEAADKSDKSYEKTYESCMKQCPTPESVPVKRDNQRLDNNQQGNPEIAPQTKTEEDNSEKKELETITSKSNRLLLQ